MTAYLEFFYDGMVVGYLEGSECPPVPGLRAYMPYRGPGHYEMFTEFERAKRVVCTLPVESGTFEILIDGIPENHCLSIASVRPITAPVLSESAQRKRQGIAHSLLKQAAGRIGLVLPPDLTSPSSLLDLSSAAAREVNMRALDLLVREAASREPRGGFWRDLARASEFLGLVESREAFTARYRQALRAIR